MTENQARNELKVTTMIDLAAICKKIAESPAVPDNLRADARDLVAEFESLLPARRKGDAQAHAHGEQLLIRCLDTYWTLPKFRPGLTIPRTCDYYYYYYYVN